MARPKLKPGLPEIAAIIGRLHAKERDPWRKNRLLAIKLAASSLAFRFGWITVQS